MFAKQKIIYHGLSSSKPDKSVSTTLVSTSVMTVKEKNIYARLTL